jgi:hypothetical protein
VRFVDSNVYRLRYRDAGGEWSSWNGGRKDKDEVFPAAKAFILKNYWTGTAAAGDMFSFNTNPGATLLKMPVLFGTPSAPISSSDIIGPGELRVSAFSVNHINSLIDSDTAVTGTTFGPKVNWNGTGASDLFGDYVTDVFHRAGVRNVVFADSTVYHNSGGSIHCGTNTIRKIPDAQWWEV